MKHFLGLLAFCLFFNTALADKVVTIACTPAQATIYRVGADNKEVALGTGSAVLKIDKDEPIKIVVRMDGYVAITKTYVNSKSVPLPKEDKIVLEDRLVKVSAQPYDARVFINGVDQASNVALATIKKDATVTVEVKKTGFSTKSKTYQNRQGLDLPPIDDFITLTERVMFVKTVPSDVQIVVNGKKIGEGNSEVLIPLQSRSVLRLNI